MVFNNNIDKSIEEAIEKKYNIEFSSGIKYDKNNIKKILSYKGKKLLHNYFPPPKLDYVLNLASLNKSIREKSINHCIEALELSSKINAKFFCAHAGFLVDPDPKDLGSKIKYDNFYDLSESNFFFLESIKRILSYSDLYKVDFYIENNVLIKQNYSKKNNRLPFFCCESDNISFFFKQINHPRFGLLLDTAHLKVTCNTLNLNLDEELEKIKPFIKAIHHSDNDGLVDNNKILSKKYWFLNYLKNFKGLPQIIEIKNLNNSEIINCIDLIKNYS